MKLDWEITGEAKGVTYNNTGNAVFTVELFFNKESIGYMNLGLDNERVGNSFSAIGEYFLKYFDVAPNFRGYKAFLGLLGIEIPEFRLPHWTPAKNSNVYVITDSEIEQANSDRARYRIKKACLNYNVFPGLELAERAINLSKLGRLILLWQYANDCIFTPNWKNNSQRKYCIKHDHINNTIISYFVITAQLDTVYFETEGQTEAFIKVYDEKIKKIMGVI